MGKYFEMILKVATAAFLRPVELFQRNIKKNMFLKSRVVTAIKASIKDFLAVLKRKPNQKSDYVLIGEQYYAKRLMMLVFLFIVFMMVIGNSLLLPLIRGRLYTPSFSLSDPTMATYSGKAKLYNREKITIYDGQLMAGVCDGKGTLYDDKGKLVYKGMFKGDAFEGEGTLYDDKGLKIYEGQFAANLFHGLGKSFDEKGRILYEGEYANGFFNGAGKKFDENGLLTYSGAFAQGLENGYGVEYFPSGSIRYNGEFLNGAYQGEGSLFDDLGKKRYAGSFAAGKFDGMGKAYSKEGDLVYEGFFSYGAYSGLGRLYDEQGLLKYEGAFLKGNFSGAGSYYVRQQKVYEGDWLDGGIHFEALIGKSSTDLRQSFFEQGKVIEADGVYGLKMNQIGLIWELSYPIGQLEPSVQKVMVYNADLTPWFKKGETLENWKKRNQIDEAMQLVRWRLVTLPDSSLYKSLTSQGEVGKVVVEKESYSVVAFFDLKTQTLLWVEYMAK